MGKLPDSLRKDSRDIPEAAGRFVLIGIWIIVTAIPACGKEIAATRCNHQVMLGSFSIFWFESNISKLIELENHCAIPTSADNVVAVAPIVI